MQINGKPQTAEEILRIAGVDRPFTPDELQREHEYRMMEAEGLGRTPERAKQEADEWLQNAIKNNSK